jgi:hypothetical protein
MQDVSGGKVNIFGGGSIVYFDKEDSHEHVYNSERLLKNYYICVISLSFKH